MKQRIGESLSLCKNLTAPVVDDTESSGMRIWEAHVLLTAVKKGLDAESAKYIIAHYETASKKLLRSLGFSNELIEMECPQHVVDRFLILAEDYPEDLEAIINEATRRYVERN